jgi:hypothetical protein
MQSFMRQWQLYMARLLSMSTRLVCHFFMLFNLLNQRSICLLKIGKDRLVPRPIVRVHVNIMEHVQRQTFALGKYFSICMDWNLWLFMSFFSTSSWSGSTCTTRKKDFSFCSISPLTPSSPALHAHALYLHLPSLYGSPYKLHISFSYLQS